MQSNGTISRDQYTEALTPFFKALGLDVNAVFVEGFAHTHDRVTGLSAVKPDDAPDDGWVSVGDVPEYAERGWPFTIEIESLD